MIIFPDISPIAFTIGVLEVRYYGMVYALSALLGYLIIKKVNQKTHQIPANIFNNFLDSFLTYSILGILIGGRLGYIIFYNFEYYFYNPLAILAIWQGGMSFHGAFLGSLIALFLLSKKYRVKYFTVLDLVALVIPIGLFFGRLANFINVELYGKPSTMPWAVQFPGVELARHPSQIYEAILEGLVIFLVVLYIYLTKKYKKTGLATGVAIMLYGIFRFFVEFFREGEIYFFNTISMGQVLSLPMIILGVAILVYINITNGRANGKPQNSTK